MTAGLKLIPTTFFFLAGYRLHIKLISFSSCPYSAADLTYFIEIASSGNITRDAERLGLTQPSLSLSVQRLEHAVGTKLIIRNKTGITLSQAGKQLLLQARSLLQQWQTIKGQALASTHEVQGRYVLGCHTSVALYSLPLFMPQLLAQHPNIEIQLHHALSRKVTEATVRMEVDLGIAVNPTRHPDLMIRKLCDDTVTFWGCAKPSINQDLSSGRAVLICVPDLLQTQELLKKMNRTGLRFARVLESSDLQVVAALTASGAGVGILPGRVVAMMGEKKFQRLSKAPTAQDEICLLYRVENKHLRSLQVMSQMISAAFTQS